MIGAIVGDIVGSVYEFSNIKTTDFELFGNDCEITDDSIITLAVAKACLDSSDNSSFLMKCEQYMREFGRRYPFPMGGYGARFSEWIHSPHMKAYNSYGNGAAMRVSPVAYKAEGLVEAEELAELSAMVTHNHPEGIKGAQATAAAIKMALIGEDKDTIKSYITANYYEQLSFLTCDMIRPTYTFNGTCQGSVPQAMTAFFESSNFEEAIRLSISLGGDSDTIGAITGSIAEAYYGVPDDIRSKAEGYIPRHLLGILHTFERTYEQ